MHNVLLSDASIFRLQVNITFASVLISHINALNRANLTNIDEYWARVNRCAPMLMLFTFLL